MRKALLSKYRGAFLKGSRGMSATLIKETTEEALGYIERIKTGYMLVEMEHYWENNEKTNQLFNELYKGLFWLQESYTLIVDGSNGAILVSPDFIEAQRRIKELNDDVKNRDWLSILDFLRFKLRSYLCLMEQAFLSIHQEDSSDASLRYTQDPLSDAQKIVHNIPVNESEIVIIFGIGTGHLIKAVLQKADPNARILLVDSDEEMIEQARRNGLLEEFSQDKRIRLILEQNESIRHEKIMNYLRENFIYVFRYLMLDSFLYSKDSQRENTQLLIREFKNARKHFELTIGNDPDDTIIGLRQFVENLPAIINSIGLSRWKDLFKGIPAFCIASGPSLEKQLPLLKEIGNKALIIAADSIVERLQKEGIKPHIITICERGEAIYQRFFKDKEFDPDTILVSYSGAYPDIFKEFPGIIIPLGRSEIPFDVNISEIIPSYDVAVLGQSVAHTSFATALALGCEPIVLLGQDLAYGEGFNTHASGVNDEVHQGRHERYTKHLIERGMVFPVAGWNGGVVNTTIIWNHFRKIFEDEILKTNCKVINATEGGAYIGGAEHIAFQKVLEDYIKEQDVNMYLNKLSFSNTMTTKNHIQQLIGYYSNEKAQLLDIQSIIINMHDLVHKVQDAVKNGSTTTFSALSNDYTDHINKLREFKGIIMIVWQYPIVKYLEKLNNLYVVTDEDMERWGDYLKKLTKMLEQLVQDLFVVLESADTILQKKSQNGRR